MIQAASSTDQPCININNLYKICITILSDQYYLIIIMVMDTSPGALFPLDIMQDPTYCYLNVRNDCHDVLSKKDRFGLVSHHGKIKPFRRQMDSMNTARAEITQTETNPQN